MNGSLPRLPVLLAIVLLCPVVGTSCSDGSTATGATPADADRARRSPPVQRAGLGVAPHGPTATTGQATDDVELVITPHGLRVVAEPYAGRQDMRAFNHFTGTTVVLLARRAQGGLIALDDDASEITTFRDSSGKDLLVAGEYAQPGLNGFPTICDDERAALLEVFGGAVPTAGASHLTVAGSLAFMTATTSDTHRAADVALAPETEFSVGDVEFTVARVGAPSWGDQAFAVTLQAHEDLTAVRALRFFDGDGAPVTYDSGMSSRFGMGDSVTIQREYCFERTLETVTIEIDFWTDLRTVRQAFELEIGPGL